MDLPHTLLSRFDLIFLLVDPHDEENDRLVQRYLSKQNLSILAVLPTIWYLSTTRRMQRGQMKIWIWHYSEIISVSIIFLSNLFLHNLINIVYPIVHNCSLREGYNQAEADWRGVSTSHWQVHVHEKGTIDFDMTMNTVISLVLQAGASVGQITAYPRQLESLIRLSEAYAKIHLREEVSR